MNEINMNFFPEIFRLGYSGGKWPWMAKRGTVGEEWGKEEMQERLYELFSRLKECQGKYSFNF